MTTAITPRVEELAARIRARRNRRKPIGPLRRVMYFGTTLDHLECGHHVYGADRATSRRHCPTCARGIAPAKGCQLEQAKRDGR